jgi:hypothetical protein
MTQTTPGPVAKLPYRAPVLRVFGPVATITETFSPSGTMKDGGPNNTKS